MKPESIIDKSKDKADNIADRIRFSPAVRGICCCGVTAATAFVATYLLVTYSIGLIYELVWLVESETGLPVASLLLLVCYCIIIASTIILIHGLMTKNSKYMLAWLITVVIVILPECILVFYMSLSHWGLQSVYGSAELICYVIRLPALVIGVVLVQSAYALRESRFKHGKSAISSVSGALAGSEFDASSYVPDASYVNDAFIEDNGKLNSSMPDIRRHLQMRQQIPQYPQLLPPPPGYWQPPMQYSSLRRPASQYQVPHSYGTWMGPRSQPYDHNYKRRHSVIGTFEDELDGKSNYEMYPDEESKSEMNYPRYYETDPRLASYYEHYGRRYEDPYGGNLMRHDPYSLAFQRERVFYGPVMRTSYASFGNESDDLTKYKDVAL